jgi:hypothetical protein
MRSATLPPGLGAFWGAATLADGSSPFFTNEYFGTQHSTEVVVTDLTGRVVGRTVANVEGKFVVVGLPVTDLRTTARLDGSRSALITPALTEPEGRRLSLFPTASPILKRWHASANGKGVREAIWDAAGGDRRARAILTATR